MKRQNPATHSPQRRRIWGGTSSAPAPIWRQHPAPNWRRHQIGVNFRHQLTSSPTLFLEHRPLIEISGPDTFGILTVGIAVFLCFFLFFFAPLSSTSTDAREEEPCVALELRTLWPSESNSSLSCILQLEVKTRFCIDFAVQPKSDVRAFIFFVFDIDNVLAENSEQLFDMPARDDNVNSPTLCKIYHVHYAICQHDSGLK